MKQPRPPPSVNWIGIVLLIGTAGCPAHAPKPPPGPPLPQLTVHLPPGCDANLTGTYAHYTNPSYHYRAQDDGKMMSISVERWIADGGNVLDAADAGPQIRLVRTARGFVGQVQATGFLASGQACQVEFPTEVVACGDAGVVLRSAATALPPDELCRPPQGASPALMLEHRLNRLEADKSRTSSPTPDAGEN